MSNFINKEKITISQCAGCINKNKEGAICKAFPDKIPDIILFSKFDHTKPFNGDNGIQFEPIDQEKKKKED